MVLNSVCKQFIKVHLGVTMINLRLPLLINQVKKETLHCENEKGQKKNLLSLRIQSRTYFD